MNHNNNHNSSCNYAEQMVSFLYDEIGDAEKASFESHLRNCPSCSDELAGFASVRSSIQEWRTEEFASLSTPAFEIPAAKNAKAASHTWVESIRAYLSFPPAWVSATAIAAILVFIGLFWFVSTSRKNIEVAGNTSEPSVKDVSPAPAQVVNHDLATAENDKEAINETEKSPVRTKINPEKDVAVQMKADERTTNGTAQLNKVKKAVPAAVDRISDKATPKKSNKNDIPSLAVDEYEDKSLRLSDIFDEVSLK